MESTSQNETYTTNEIDAARALLGLDAVNETMRTMIDGKPVCARTWQDEDYSAFDLNGPAHKQADQEFRDKLADTVAQMIGYKFTYGVTA